MNIILMGMKHCGKSTVGRRLAAELGLPFFDLDDLILERCGQDGGGPGIEDLFRDKGAETFFSLEAEAYGSICGAAGARKGFVLAVGGRTPFNPRLERVLEQCGVLIYINTPFETILKRITEKGTSTLLSNDDPGRSLRKIYDDRHPVYLRRARVVVDGDRDVLTVVKLIRDGLQEFERGGQ